MAIRGNAKQIAQNNFGSENIKDEIEVKYNPYIFELSIINTSIELDRNSKIKSILEKYKGKALHIWYKELLKTIKEEFNSRGFKFIFQGREEDYSDLKDEIEYLNKNEGYNIISELKELKDKENVLFEIKEYMDNILDNAPEELKEELEKQNVRAEFEKAQGSQAEISVIATMSSGKSTLLNGILGKELLPAKNEACTATIGYITDNKKLNDFKMKVEDIDGNILKDWKEANLEDIKEANEEGNNKVISIYLEGPIKGVNCEEMQLVLIDTPGPNNSQNTEHKEATYRFIKDTKNNPLILYVLNATQQGTNDDERLLKEIADIIKKNGKQASERFIFALNKIDCLDPDRESVEGLIQNCIKYLEEHDIENPKIFPLSAEAGKIVRLKFAGENLTRTQQGNLNTYKLNLLPDETEGYVGIDTIKYASIPESLKRTIYREAQKDEETAVLCYSGIVAIEKYIERYVNKYSKAQKIKESINSLKRVVDTAYKEVKTLSGKTEEELTELAKQIENVEEVLRNSGKDKIEQVKDEINSIKYDEIEYMKLLKDVGDRINEVLKVFDSSKKIDEREAKRIIVEANKELEQIAISAKTTCENIYQVEIAEKTELILDELKKYFERILEEVDLDVELQDTLMDKFTLDMPDTYDLIDEAKYEVREKVGERYVKTVSTSKWWNPFTWGDEEDIYEDIYETKSYVDGSKMRDKFDPISINIRKAINDMSEKTDEKIEIIKNKAFENIEQVEITIENILKDLREKLEKQKELKRQNEIANNSANEIVKYKKMLDKILEI